MQQVAEVEADKENSTADAPAEDDSSSGSEDDGCAEQHPASTSASWDTVVEAAWA